MPGAHTLVLKVGGEVVVTIAELVAVDKRAGRTAEPLSNFIPAGLRLVARDRAADKLVQRINRQLTAQRVSERLLPRGPDRKAGALEVAAAGEGRRILALQRDLDVAQVGEALGIADNFLLLGVAALVIRTLEVVATGDLLAVARQAAAELVGPVAAVIGIAVAARPATGGVGLASLPV